MTRVFLYSYPIAILFFVYIATVSTLKSYYHATGPLGYCTVRGEDLQEDERHAIALAKRFVERTKMGDAWELDGRYRVHADSEGYQVHVLFVSGYGISGRPILIPGGHCMVNISPDGKIEYGKAPGPSIMDSNTSEALEECFQSGGTLGGAIDLPMHWLCGLLTSFRRSSRY